MARYWLVLLDAVAARRRGTGDQNRSHALYASILVPIDLEEPGSWAKAVPTALAMSRCFGARLTLATIVEDKDAAHEAQWSAIAYRELLAAAQVRLATLADQLCGEAQIDTKVGGGGICEGIIGVANEVEADLIVLASHRLGMKDWLLGANASRVVRMIAALGANHLRR